MNEPMMGSPMGDDQMQDQIMGGGVPMENNPDMGMPMDGGQNQFDTNFDAGVEADENADPKKYIQQLTGKLSQTLRNYNDGQPQADADLNKYVAGMIIKQAIDGLSPEDVQDVLGKVKSNEDVEQPQDLNKEQLEMQQPQFDGVESKQMSKYSNDLNETLTLDDNDEEDTLNQYRGNNKNNHGYKTKPFRP